MEVSNIKNCSRPFKLSGYFLWCIYAAYKAKSDGFFSPIEGSPSVGAFSS